MDGIVEDCTEDADDGKSSLNKKPREITETPERKGGKSKRQRSATKKSDKPSKRRKRIKEIRSDSDSDGLLLLFVISFSFNTLDFADMFADNDLEKSEDIIDNSDEEQPIAKAKIETPPPVKNKKRKLVDKTFEDEEGFISTLRS